MIPYGRQSITDADIDAVARVLRSDFLTQGPAVAHFEDALKIATSADHAIAVNSATSALHIACLALGAGPGQTVWTSPNSFVASANCALYCGASVDFVDIDPDTYNMCAKALERKLDRAEAEERLPSIVIPVHFAGQSADMEAIAALSRRYGFKIIEDASHAIGADYQGRPIGDCRYSDVCVFSFHPVKIITTGEGGAATTNHAGLAARMGRLRSHGVTRDEALMDGASHGGWYYQQVELGLNYRMTDLQAALGVSQMDRLRQFIEQRRALAARYDKLLDGLPLTKPGRCEGVASSWHLYVVQLDETLDRRAVFDAMRAAGIGVHVHYIPIHIQPYYRQLGFRSADFPAAEAYYDKALSLPLFHGMTHDQQDEVVETLKSIVGARDLRRSDAA